MQEKQVQDGEAAASVVYRPNRHERRKAAALARKAAKEKARGGE